MLRFEKRIPVKRCGKFTIKAQKTGVFTGAHRLGQTVSVTVSMGASSVATSGLSRDPSDVWRDTERDGDGSHESSVTTSPAR